MDKAKLQAYRDWVQSELKTCANFWLENGMDRVNGGVYTCLDRKGEIYSTDKSVWMQGRCGWTFSYPVPPSTASGRSGWRRPRAASTSWRTTASTVRPADRMYFTVTAEGKPLRQRRYCFSEGFYVHGQRRVLRRHRGARSTWSGLAGPMS